jgi:hypothetical protein
MNRSWDRFRASLLLSATTALAFSGCAHVPRGETTPEPLVKLDLAGIDAWLACMRRGGEPMRCEAASAATVGGQIAVASMSSFGDTRPELDRPVAVKSVGALVDAVRAFAPAQIVEEAAAVLPRKVGGGAIPVFIVGNGHPWGDGYVRNIRFTATGKPELADKGAPVVVANAILVATKYPGSADEQAQTMRNLFVHEVFHLLFARFQLEDARWRGLPQELSPIRQLMLVTLDEGMAHFLSERRHMKERGLPTERIQQAYRRLSEALEQLRSLPPNSALAQSILDAANVGQFWNKFGSISGLGLAYGVDAAFGTAGLQESLACGPGRLIRRYEEAAAKLPSLPPLSPTVREAARDLDLCAANAGP